MTVREELEQILDGPVPEKLYPLFEDISTRHGSTFAYVRKFYYEIKRARLKQASITDKPPEERTTSREIKTDADGKLTESFTTTKPIRTLEEALAESDADLSIYDVHKWGKKTWGTTMKLTTRVDGKITDEQPYYQTNHLVWIEFVMKDHTAEYVEKIKEAVLSWKPIKIPVVQGSGVGVINLADFHIGADIKELVRTLDFDVNILQERLALICSIINSRQYKEVHVNLIGDFIESFTGLNHINSWRSMDKKMVGANVVEVATRILSNFLGGINNLAGINIVAGNHDRSTPDSKIDNVGEIAGILAYTLGLVMDVDIDYNPFLISKEIDGIWYVITHGHTAASQKDAGKFLFEHGNNKYYNVLLVGHTHSRKTIKTYKKQFYTYESVQVVSLDDLNYRKIVVGPLFTGNWYSEGLGFASNPGFLETYNNGRNRPTVVDHSC